MVLQLTNGFSSLKSSYFYYSTNYSPKLMDQSSGKCLTMLTIEIRTSRTIDGLLSYLSISHKKCTMFRQRTFLALHNHKKRKQKKSLYQNFNFPMNFGLTNESSPQIYDHKLVVSSYIVIVQRILH